VTGGFDPAAYEAWYNTPRGRWIAEREFDLLWRLLSPSPGASLLDVGCGTGHFSRRFADKGLAVTGLDPDPHVLKYAASLGGDLRYLEGDAHSLPFADESFDCVTAITSLCFVSDPATALREMWRVTRRSLVLGLLNRHSLLYLAKRNSGGYRGARWDRVGEIKNDWLPQLMPVPTMSCRSVIYFPAAGPMGRWLESGIPSAWPLGGFLVVLLQKQ
jgi:SAM-dependent methyltransferase